ncbi:troponin I, fast skeletal muscle isoform X1 [Gadus morhua]|uniref:Troponin I2, fast skeletal type n=1 Tax=Gadus morhua TaxID=8049 RepID=A0A8C4ZQW3_GADMO|nr:troponin I, fast skeletal muscle-like isoform X1 [Gadus morhua]XP_056464614.1 troponin I, fast skeletal muscle-like [Gadus chalcogrammus]
MDFLHSKMSEKKVSSSRKSKLKSLLLQIGQSMLEQESLEVERRKISYMEEKCPPLNFPQSMPELQELCEKLHNQIDLVDEERYDAAGKVSKSRMEIDDLKMVVQDLNGRFKKPALRRVRMSAEAMVAALLGSKHKVSMDLRGNLQQVKREVKEEEKHTGDWRKNIEDKSGMDGRKKMFETEA